MMSTFGGTPAMSATFSFLAVRCWLDPREEAKSRTQGAVVVVLLQVYEESATSNVKRSFSCRVSRCCCTVCFWLTTETRKRLCQAQRSVGAIATRDLVFVEETYLRCQLPTSGVQEAATMAAVAPSPAVAAAATTTATSQTPSLREERAANILHVPSSLPSRESFYFIVECKIRNTAWYYCCCVATKRSLGLECEDVSAKSPFDEEEDRHYAESPLGRLPSLYLAEHSFPQQLRAPMAAGWLSLFETGERVLPHDAHDVILGRSGCLLIAHARLSGLLRPTSGTILIDTVFIILKYCVVPSRASCVDEIETFITPNPVTCTLIKRGLPYQQLSCIAFWRSVIQIPVQGGGSVRPLLGSLFSSPNFALFLVVWSLGIVPTTPLINSELIII